MNHGNAALAMEPAGPMLTVLSCGMGQDSKTLFLHYLYDLDFRRTYAPNDFLVVFAETGDEHPETYEEEQRVRQLCADHEIPYCHITPDLGYHSATWQSLNHFYDNNKAVGSKCFPKTCTDKLKLVPIYKYLENYLGDTYGVETGRKKGFYQFAERYGKIRVLVGIAKGEEARMADPAKDPNKWKRENVEVVYPLVDLGLDRAGCQEYIKSVGHVVPLPSNCKRCPFMSKVELLWMAKFLPEDYADWVRQEQIKLANNQHMGDRNLGVWGKKTLPEVLAEAQQTYGHWSDEDLHDYKMSHGHCVASRY